MIRGCTGDFVEILWNYSLWESSVYEWGVRKFDITDSPTCTLCHLKKLPLEYWADVCRIFTLNMSKTPEAVIVSKEGFTETAVNIWSRNNNGVFGDATCFHYEKPRVFQVLNHFCCYNDIEFIIIERPSAFDVKGMKKFIGLMVILRNDVPSMDDGIIGRTPDMFTASDVNDVTVACTKWEKFAPDDRECLFCSGHVFICRNDPVDIRFFEGMPVEHFFVSHKPFVARFLWSCKFLEVS